MTQHVEGDREICRSILGTEPRPSPGESECEQPRYFEHREEAEECFAFPKQSKFFCFPADLGAFSDDGDDEEFFVQLESNITSPLSLHYKPPPDIEHNRYRTRSGIHNLPRSHIGKTPTVSPFFAYVRCSLCCACVYARMFAIGLVSR